MRFEDRLAREVTGEVFFDRFNRGRYATDASFYQIMPAGVVVPRTIDEALRTLGIARDDGRIEALAIQRLVARRVPVDGRARRRPALPHHRGHLAVMAWIDEHEGFAAQAVEVLLDNAADEQRRDAGIERIAAAREDLERRGRRQRMAGRNAGIASHDGRTLGGRYRGRGMIGRQRRENHAE